MSRSSRVLMHFSWGVPRLVFRVNRWLLRRFPIPGQTVQRLWQIAKASRQTQQSQLPSVQKINGQSFASEQTPRRRKRLPRPKWQGKSRASPSPTRARSVACGLRSPAKPETWEAQLRAKSARRAFYLLTFTRMRTIRLIVIDRPRIRIAIGTITLKTLYTPDRIIRSGISGFKPFTTQMSPSSSVPSAIGAISMWKFLISLSF